MLTAAAVAALLFTSFPMASTASAQQTEQLSAALDGAGSGAASTNLGNLIADAVASTAGTHIALVAADEITETSVGPGNVDPEEIVHTLSYFGDDTDTVVVLDLTGKQLLDALTRSASRLPQKYPGFLQVSGLHVSIDHGTVSAATSDGVQIAALTHYRVATTSPLASGELGYFDILGKGAKVQETATSLAQSVRSYLTVHRVLSGLLETRIVVHA